jgi:methionyl aminopeptidase
MIELKSRGEMDLQAKAGSVIWNLFQELEARVGPGVTTLQLDSFAEEFIRSYEGAVPVFKGLYGFPGSVCVSLNEEIVHGIPSAERTLVEGDILSIDVGVKLEGWCADSARTFPVGDVAPETARLLEVTEEALERAIEAAVPGNHVGDIGHAVQEVVRGTGFAIIRDLVGHGIGRKVHEDPQVPNRGKPGEGPLLQEGMVLAIEPMISTGNWRIRTLEDRWTMVTVDGSPSAHFEHTVGVTAEAPRVLTGAPVAVEAG